MSRQDKVPSAPAPVSATSRVFLASLFRLASAHVFGKTRRLTGRYNVGSLGVARRGQLVGACLRKTDEVPRATSPSCARQALGACRLGVCVVCVVCVCVCVVGPARDG